MMELGSSSAAEFTVSLAPITSDTSAEVKHDIIIEYNSEIDY